MSCQCVMYVCQCTPSLETNRSLEIEQSTAVECTVYSHIFGIFSPLYLAISPFSNPIQYS